MPGLTAVLSRSGEPWLPLKRRLKNTQRILKEYLEDVGYALAARSQDIIGQPSDWHGFAGHGKSEVSSFEVVAGFRSTAPMPLAMAGYALANVVDDLIVEGSSGTLGKQVIVRSLRPSVQLE